MRDGLASISGNNMGAIARVVSAERWMGECGNELRNSTIGGSLPT